MEDGDDHSFNIEDYDLFVGEDSNNAYNDDQDDWYTLYVRHYRIFQSILLLTKIMIILFKYSHLLYLS